MGYDGEWWKIDKIVHEYWVSHPREIWKDGNVLRTSFDVYGTKEFINWKIKILDEKLRQIGWKVFRVSKPKKEPILGRDTYRVRIYISK